MKVVVQGKGSGGALWSLYPASRHWWVHGENWEVKEGDWGPVVAHSSRELRVELVCFCDRVFRLNVQSALCFLQWDESGTTYLSNYRFMKCGILVLMWSKFRRALVDLSQVDLDLDDEVGALDLLADTFATDEVSWFAEVIFSSQGEGENVYQASLDKPILSSNKGNGALSVCLSFTHNRI